MIRINYTESILEFGAASEEKKGMMALGAGQWLESFCFPTLKRKHPTVKVSLETRDVCIETLPTTEELSNNSDGLSSEPDEAYWRKQITSALKKIKVEDLGNMDAMELRASIPEQDSEGRGMADMLALQKQLSVCVVFCENQHVLLVGSKTKLEKKCFVLRNILSHYHYRLSGKDVAFS